MISAEFPKDINRTDWNKLEAWPLSGTLVFGVYEDLMNFILVFLALNAYEAVNILGAGMYNQKGGRRATIYQYHQKMVSSWCHLSQVVFLKGINKIRSNQVRWDKKHCQLETPYREDREDGWYTTDNKKQYDKYWISRQVIWLSGRGVGRSQRDRGPPYARTPVHRVKSKLTQSHAPVSYFSIDKKSSLFLGFQTHELLWKPLNTQQFHSLGH